MQKPKLKVLVAMFAYAGNGGVATVLPSIATWLAKTCANAGPHVEGISVKQYGDIPLTMERNRVVRDAKANGYDVIIMLDSDNCPDLYLGHDEAAKPFFQTSIEFLHERAMRGLPTVVCAPYCGPPPHPVKGGVENVYVFHAAGTESQDGNDDVIGAISVEQYTREHASIMTGIQECIAGPTGCIMYSTDAFDLINVTDCTDEEILLSHKEGKITTERARQLLRMESWFWYEFTDGLRTSKASTEDVTNTREIQLASYLKFKEPTVFCNWDAWAGHMKPKCVGRPHPLRSDQVSAAFKEAVLQNIEIGDEAKEVDFTGDEEEFDEPYNQEDEVEGVEYEEEMKQVYGKMVLSGLPWPKYEHIDERVCTTAHHICESKNAQKVFIIGDCGAITDAVIDGKRTVYVGCELPGFDAYDSLGDRPVRRFDMGETPHETVKMMEPQGLDLIVLDTWSGYPAMRQELIGLVKHLADGGTLMMIGEGLDRKLDYLIDEIGGEGFRVDETDIYIWSKNAVPAEPDV